MERKLPYYLTYPMILLHDDEMREHHDYAYMKSIYPLTAKKLVPHVEEACDRMEYSCSMMYDEYPDKLQLDLMVKRIYDKVKETESDPGKWLEDLIWVMLCQELYKRRCDHRKYRRKYY